MLSRLERPWLAALWVVLGVLVLAAGGRGARWLRANLTLPTRDAEWIWAPEVSLTNQPVAFWAVRDFRLPQPPPESGRLLLVGDQEYLVYLNGKWVGSGRYTSGDAVAEYDVSALLTPGTNRLAVLARSTNGAGGLLVSLFLGEDGPMVVSDGDWRIFRQHRAGLLEGWQTLGEGPTAAVWQLPPTGRWGAPATVVRHAFVLPELDPRVRWAETIEQVRASCGESEPAEGSAVLVDFGLPLTGYLELWVEGEGVAYPVQLGVDSRPALDAKSNGDPDSRADVVMMPVPGADVWRDASPRRLRYALVQGVGRVKAARMHLVDPSSTELVSGPDPGKRGLWGLEPPTRELEEKDEDDKRDTPADSRRSQAPAPCAEALSRGTAEPLARPLGEDPGSRREGRGGRPLQKEDSRQPTADN